MNITIDRLCSFAAKYFCINERDLYSKVKSNHCILAKHIVWYILHYEHKISTSVIAKEFFRTRRMVFLGISKMKHGIAHQRYYKDIYEKFFEEYKKST